MADGFKSAFTPTKQRQAGMGLANSYVPATNYTYKGTLTDGSTGYSGDLGAFQSGSVVGAQEQNPGMFSSLFGDTKFGDTKGITPQGGLASNSITGGLSVLGDVLSGVGSVMNARNAQKGLKMAKEQFDFSKAAANRNVANQAQLTNNAIQNAGEVGLALAGGTMDDAARANRQAQLNSMKVSGSPIG